MLLGLLLSLAVQWYGSRTVYFNTTTGSSPGLLLLMFRPQQSKNMKCTRYILNCCFVNNKFIIRLNLWSLMRLSNPPKNTLFAKNILIFKPNWIFFHHWLELFCTLITL